MRSPGPNRFPSKETRPTDSDLQVVLGDERYGLWQTVARELGLLSDAADVLWAGDGMGWVWRFTKGDVTLASLYPDGMCFTADFALGPDELASVGDDVGQEAVASIRQQAGPGRDCGIWAQWPVRQRRDAQLLASTLRAKARLV